MFELGLLAEPVCNTVWGGRIGEEYAKIRYVETTVVPVSNQENGLALYYYR